MAAIVVTRSLADMAEMLIEIRRDVLAQEIDIERYVAEREVEVPLSDWFEWGSPRYLLGYRIRGSDYPRRRLVTNLTYRGWTMPFRTTERELI
jgi:hypothetical protein